MQLWNTSGPSNMRSLLWKVHALRLMCVGILAGAAASFLLHCFCASYFLRTFSLELLVSCQVKLQSHFHYWVCVCVFRKNVSVFKKWGMFLFLYDIGRRGWTGEGYPAVALFAGLADAPSEWWTDVLCVSVGVSVAILHSVLDHGSWVRNMSRHRDKPHNTHTDILPQQDVLMKVFMWILLLCGSF